MAGTKIGGQKAAAKNIEKNPNFYSDIGRVGGSVKGAEKGFGANRELAKTAGRAGGLKSRRGKAIVEVEAPRKRRFLNIFAR